MSTEQDTPPQANTFRWYVWRTVESLGYLRAYWGRRFVGGAIGLISDMIAEGAQQAFFARLPGHPQQAPDSLARVGLDREIFRFRNESKAAFIDRIRNAWRDYEQGGTPQQVLRAVNQFGLALWPNTWDVEQVTLTESTDPAVFSFSIGVPFGLVDPPFENWEWGDGSTWGQDALFWGLDGGQDVWTLLWLIRKWKPSRSVATVVLGISESIELEIAV